VEFADLYADVLTQVPDNRRAALEELVEEYGASESFSFLLAVTACTGRREWQLIRLLLRKLELLEQGTPGNAR
jgi:hypothetical protein